MKLLPWKKTFTIIKQKKTTLIFLTVLLVGCWLAACSQLPNLGALPTLPATIVVPGAASMTPSAVQSQLTMTLDPATPRVEVSTTPLSSTDAADTQAAKDALNQAQTALAELEKANASPTPCINNRCPKPTVTPWVWHSRTPTITSTPTTPSAYLILMRPGPQSKLVSPISLEAAAHTGSNGDIRVELIGEDGQAIVRKIMRVSNDAYLQFYLSTNIDFEISTVSEAARLQISVDDEFHRPIALSSVDIILLSLGENDRNPVTDGSEPFIIRKPLPDQVISGGKVTVEGLARPFNKQPLQLELISEQGTVVGVKQVYLTPSPDGQYVPFSAEIPYTITKSRGVRLVIHQDGERIPGVIALNSLTLYLQP